MANSYTIKKTNGDVAVTILAGGANGDSGIANGHDTDLLLYGRGTFNWGAGIEQNLVRLTENWAYPSANQNATTNQQYPAIPNVTGQGIKKPIKGQTWFNSSNNKLYVNVNGANNAGAWRVDHIDYNYLELPKTTDQTMEGKLRIRSANHQPDLYIESTRVGYGIGTAAGGANAGASSFITFEGTDVDGDRTRGAYVANYHNNNTLRIALGDREYTEVNTTSGATEKKSYAGSAILNYLQLEATQTITTREIRQIGDEQIAGYGTGGIYFRTLTTAEWVYHYVKDQAQANVELYGDPRYLKLSDATSRIQTDGDARYVQLSGDTMTGPLDVFYADPRIVIAAPYGDGTVDHNASLKFKYGSQFLAEMYMLTGGDVTTNMVGTFNQSAYTSDSKIIIQKNDGGAIPVNGIVIYDDEIRTHHTRGKIHTPETANNDDDDTLTTKGYVDTKVGDVDLSNYYIKDDKLAITRTSGDLDAAIFVSSVDLADITIETTGTSTDSIGRLSFKTNGGYRGFVGMLTKVPTGTEDTLVIRKQQASTIYNEIQVQDEITQFKKRLAVIPNDGAVAPGLDLQCTKNNAAFDNWINETGYDPDNPNGVIWKNSNGAVRGAIQHNNTNALRLSLTPNGGTTGILSGSDTTYLELGTSLIKVNKEVELDVDARPSPSDSFPNNYRYATNHGVVARTYDTTQVFQMRRGSCYPQGSDTTVNPAWQTQFTSANQEFPDTTFNNSGYYPHSTFNMNNVDAENFSRNSVFLDISFDSIFKLSQENNTSWTALDYAIEYQFTTTSTVASSSGWTAINVGRMEGQKTGNAIIHELHFRGSAVIPCSNTSLYKYMHFRLPRTSGVTSFPTGIFDYMHVSNVRAVVRTM